MAQDFFKYKNNFELYANVLSKRMDKNSERKPMKYTIAIPTYKRPELLEKALDSAINQKTELDYEIIIVDNDPDSLVTDNLLKAHTTKKIYYFKNDTNIGMFGNWNRCIELAKGEYITILNDDDILSTDYLRKCEINLKTGVDGLIFKYTRLYEQNFTMIEKKEGSIILKNILIKFSKDSKKLSLFDFYLGNKSAGSLGVLFRTEDLKLLGGYNPDYFPSSDYVLHANYCYRFNLYLINEKLNYYRVAENESAKQENLQKWEYTDNEIRKYFIPLIGKNKKMLLMLNKIIQENRVKWLVDNWNYHTETRINYKLKNKIFQKLIGLKYYLNI